jgi:hypothetical protein
VRSGIITLTTDFGEKDPFVGVMKGVIFSRYPAAKIVDLTHQIAPQAIIEAAFWIERSFRWFPAGTVHVAVVDPGVGTSRAILAVEAEGHVFLAPDNGLLGPVLEASPAAAVRAVDPASLALPVPFATFHGRDIFAPFAAELASDRVPFAGVGPEASAKSPSALEKPRVSAYRVEGRVVTIDRFGNLITNIRSDVVARYSRPLVLLGSLSLQMVRTFGDAVPGEQVALIGSFDTVEIAVVNGDAASQLGVRAGAEVFVRDQPRA